MALSSPAYSRLTISVRYSLISHTVREGLVLVSEKIGASSSSFVYHHLHDFFGVNI
jgi:hypothetical protein